MHFKVNRESQPKNALQLITWHFHFIYLVLRHPRTPLHSRVIAATAVGYVFSPIQLIPSFIPIIGQLDDALVLWWGSKLLQKWTPAEILSECHSRTRPSWIEEIPGNISSANVVYVPSA